MRKVIAVVLSVFMFFGAMAQSINLDKLYKHSEETLDVKVIKVGEFGITYKYAGEDAEQVISKLAVSKIVYGSGRTEDISDKIVVADKNDWEKVQIVTDKVQVAGLKKGEEVKGKTSGMLSYNTAGSADKKATRKIKVAAAEMGAPFVLFTSDNNAVAYSYN
jgi:hypothetical protein